MSAVVPVYHVTSLFKMAAISLQNSLSACVTDHSSKCHICSIDHHMDRCSTMQGVKDCLQLLPPILKNTILQQFHDRNDFKYTAYYWLLENTHLEISLEFDDTLTPFLMKFGSYVRSLSFKFYAYELDICSVPACWRNTFFTVSNLQNLDLSNCDMTNLLEIIGKECVQLRKIKSDIAANISATEFKKFCVRKLGDTEIRNPLCDTLEEFIFDYQYSELVELQQIALLLFQNVTNLHNLGYFQVDRYLSSAETDICVTGLKSALVHSGNEHMLPLLRKYCPKMDVLKLGYNFQLNSFQNIHDFLPDLKGLYAVLPEEEYEDYNNDFPELYKIIKTYVWPKMKVLDICFNTLTVELGDLTVCLPNLETLQLKTESDTGQITWNGRTYFRKLDDVHISLTNSNDTQWVAAFAKTVTKFYFCSIMIGADKDTCSSLLTVSLPKLEVLELDFFKYDFDFLTKIVMKCPSLKTLHLVDLVQGCLLIKDLEKFIKKYNYECELDYQLHPSL